jgi:hypothetical protein
VSFRELTGESSLGPRAIKYGGRYKVADSPTSSALNGRELWGARQSAAMNWHHPDDVPSDVLNRILWWDSKGYNTAYPVRRQ